MSAKIQTLISDKKISELISHVEDLEFEHSGESKDAPPYSVQLLAYLIVNDLDSARFLWKRLPDGAKKDQQLNAAWNVGKAMWVRDYPSIHQALGAYNWDAVHVALVNILKAEFHKRTVNLVAKAFTSISTTSLASFLGVSVDQASAFAKQKGWAEQDGFVIPTSESDKSLHLASVDNLSSLAEYAVYLETDFSIPWTLRENAAAAAKEHSKAAAASKGGATAKKGGK